MIDEKEIQSEITSKTKLWERAQFQVNGNSRFGLCLVNSKSTDKLFEESITYQPSYFPEGMSIDIITNEQNPELPWTFRLPYRGEKKMHNEPIEHTNGIKMLTHVEFEVTNEASNYEFINGFKELEDINFKEAERRHLTLEFDNKVQGKTIEFPALTLTIAY